MLRILKDQRGFTLIELVIIIILIGVLAGVAIPRFVNLRGEAIEAKAKAMQDAGKAAMTLDFADQMINNGSYTSPVTCGSPPCDVTTPSTNLTNIEAEMEGTPSYPPTGTYGSAAGTGFRWKVSNAGGANTPARIYATYDGTDVDGLDL